MNAGEAVRRDLEITSERIAAARRLVDVGDSVDLSGLECSVDAICGAIRKLPAEDQPPLKLPIVGLVDELDKLSEDLRTQHSKLSKGLKALSSGEQAAKAYGQTGGKREK